MRPTRGQVETRALPGDLTVEGRKLRGFIPYGVESRDLGGWREVIEPGALNGADLGDLVVTAITLGCRSGAIPARWRSRRATTAWRGLSSRHGRARTSSRPSSAAT